MAFHGSRDALTRRIDRCYLIAAGARKPEKRKIHLELARSYRDMLAAIAHPQLTGPAETVATASLPESSH